jgi:TPP-dependent pyruvate/acetoin dehydrogenase alpha subunit
MATKLTKQDLIDFEEDIAAEFNAGKIKTPVHLSFGNENQLIKIFEKINEDDWVVGSWRSHFHCLLKGVDQKELKQSIMEGKSISLSFPDQRVFCSAIVAGSLSIAVGIALSIKRRGGNNKVCCFLGDMTAETGAFHECLKYSENFDLPIVFVIEDNNLSVCTDTRKTWETQSINGQSVFALIDTPHVGYYEYRSKWPHAGAGKRIQF